MNGYINSHINEVSMLDLYLNMIYCDFLLQPVDMKRSVSDVLSDYVFRAEDAAYLFAGRPPRAMRTNSNPSKIKLRQDTTRHLC